MKISTIWTGQNALGEGPLWHPQEQVLYWVDIAESCLHRMDPGSGQHQQWSMPAPIGCIALRQQGSLIAGIGNEICFIDLPSGKVRPQTVVPDGLRLNDGKCDRLGRFWVGTAIADIAGPSAAHLYRFDPDGRLSTIEENIYISNGLAWSADNKLFYYTDSLQHCIHCYDFEADTGTISNKRVFANVPEADGLPDGLTIDNAGYIWSAQFYGSRVTRYAPDGTIDRVIAMPTARITSCAFGGPDDQTLFVTSCSRNLGETQTLPPPAGALYAIEGLGVCGVPELAFLG